MKNDKSKSPKLTKYNSFEAMKAASGTKRKLTDEEALEKALEMLDFFNSLKNAKPLN